MLTQKDIDELGKVFVTKFNLKDALSQLKSDIFDKLDSILKEIVASREERTAMSHQITNHEDRITKLESSKTN
jgi:hypothetical protein